MQENPTDNSRRVLPQNHQMRFQLPHPRIGWVFGNDWFAVKAEVFARFFGTPFFLISQTVIVIAWVALNTTGFTYFDIYPFILLNLAFSLQAAYAAPLILLAQTRQADRDKAHAEADALHREELAHLAQIRLDMTAEQNIKIMTLLEQNTQLTESVKAMGERIEMLTSQIHGKLVSGGEGD